MPAESSSKSDRFPCFEPNQQIVLEKLKRDIAAEFERCGFVPLETPCVEPKSVLSINPSLDEKTYALIRAPGERRVREELGLAIQSLASGNAAAFIARHKAAANADIAFDPGDRDEIKLLKIIAHLEKSSETELALHNDLTVPLANFVKEHEAAAPEKRLVFPFRRYQIQKVWRANSLNASSRNHIEEFYQCDIDVIGQKNLALLTDAEIPSIIYRLFRSIRIGKFVISIGNTKVSNAFLRHVGVGRALGAGTVDERKALEACGLIISERRVTGTQIAANALAAAAGISRGDAWKALAFLDEPYVSPAHTRERLMSLGDNQLSEAAQELCSVADDIRLFDVPESYIRIDPGMFRGLSYYTGTTYETELVDHPGIGSICSGGRYDDLMEKGTTKERYPGVGISINLTPLFKRLLMAKLVAVGRATTASVLVTTDHADRAQTAASIALAQKLRWKGINTEIFLEDETTHEQIRHATLKGFAAAIIVPGASSADSEVKIKNLVLGGLVSCPLEKAVGVTKDLLAKLQRAGKRAGPANRSARKARRKAVARA